MPKVTVIIPTYRLGPDLDGLVLSIDAQTLPQEDIEVLLVDDGSPDDTYERLLAFTATRPNYRAFALPPSGWPSRPRNFGIDRARGEYVVFADHDDRLFPDALRAAWTLAVRAGADVVDGKESKSDTRGWAMRDLDVDVLNAIDWIDPHPLLPMNPHKMFRTQFLRDEGIRFPEGGRQIWEDICFDIAAHARAQVVSLLVETPFYLWNRPESATTSATFYDDLSEYLAAIDRVFGWIEAELRQERFAELYPRFVAYQLHMRVLPLFEARSFSTPERKERICAFVAELLPRVTPDADSHLDPWRRIKVALLRAGRFDLVERHERTVPRLICTATADEVQWDATGVSFAVAIAWQLAAGQASAVQGSAVEAIADRRRLRLDPEVAEFARVHDLDADVTEGLAATTWAIERRSRAQKIDWGLVRGAHPPLGEAPDVLLADTVRARWSLADDPRLHDGVWDLHIRTVVLRTRVVRQVHTDLDAHRWATIGGRVVAAYRTRGGALALDVGQRVLNVVDDARQPPTAQRSGADYTFAIPLDHVEVLDSVDVPGALVDAQGRVVADCLLAASAGRAELRAVVPHSRVFAVRLGDTVSRTRFRIDRRGQVTTVRDAGGWRRRLPRRLRGLLRTMLRPQ